jgi:hypothetical protein
MFRNLIFYLQGKIFPTRDLWIKTNHKRKSLSFILLTVLILVILQTCVGQDCNKLPLSFSSFQQASQLVKSSTLKIKENVNTSKSSWIRQHTLVVTRKKAF